jgi:hypothetical protein
MNKIMTSPFNSALETGVRMLAILVASYPTGHDLGRLVQYDYLTVHSADADGPPSLHPALPMRSGELLVRRRGVESGLRLMISRSLLRCEPHMDGFIYLAEDAASAFLHNLRSPYIIALRERAEWVAATFNGYGAAELDRIVEQLFEAWTTEFQLFEQGPQGE